MAEEAALVPLRMVNEYVYCPRLFWLEYVDREFADSHDTVDGRRVHRNVDRPSAGTLAAEDEDIGSRRSVTLASERLGIVGTLDLVEREAGEAIPVDYKRGTVPRIAARAYDPERVQLCLQGLLLREAGFRCERGYLYFAASRTRVEVPFDDELVVLARCAVDEARVLAAAEHIPPPLEDSPKCPRCSLVGICLPDETNALRATEPRQVRPLVVPAEIAGPVYVVEPGASVGKSEDVLQIKKDRAVVDEVRLIDCAHLSVFGNVQVSTQATRALLERGSAIFYFSYGAWLSGMTIPPAGHSLDARIAQHRCWSDPERSLELARAIVEGKIRNQRTLVRRSLGKEQAARDLGRLAFFVAQCRRVRSADELLGVEGMAARTYFGCFARMLRGERRFVFGDRNRRPPRDPVNATLSFLYALLVRDCVAGLLAVGLDPGLGLFHTLRLGRPSLALDLAEEFRPLVADSVALSALNTGELEERHFVQRGAGVALTDDGRRAVIGAYERRMGAMIVHELFGYSVSYRRVVAIQARLLARYLEGDVPAYPAFTTR
jgi:CRISPR-associated protein Cas1